MNGSHARVFEHQVSFQFVAGARVSLHGDRVCSETRDDVCGGLSDERRRYENKQSC